MTPWQSLTRVTNRSLFADEPASPKALGVRTTKLQSTVGTTGYGYRGLKLPVRS